MVFFILDISVVFFILDIGMVIINLVTVMLFITFDIVSSWLLLTTSLNMEDKDVVVVAAVILVIPIKIKNLIDIRTIITIFSIHNIDTKLCQLRATSHDISYNIILINIDNGLKMNF